MGVRTCLCYEISDRHGKIQADRAIEENVRFINKVQKQTSDMQKAMMGMHAQFTLSDDTIEKAVAKTPAGVGAHIHVAEGISEDRKSTRLNSSHVSISYAVFCLKKNRKLKV